MDEIVVTLPCNDSGLRIITDANGWARLSLLDRPQTSLGAESLRVLTERLRAALRDPVALPVAGEIAGRSVHWVTGLSETHTTIYASGDARHLILYFQGRAREILGKLELDEATIAVWLRELGAR
jgi:hypothetical protein